MERKDFVRSINTSEIIEAVYHKGSPPPLFALPPFNPNIVNDVNWYRLKEANDGDCLYWCILQALEDNNIFHEITNIAELRMHIYHTLMSNPSLVDEWKFEFLTEGLKNGVNNPEDQQNWGNEHHFPILTNLYNMSIYVFDTVEKHAWEEFLPLHLDQNTINLFLEFTGSHYNILLPRSHMFSNIKPKDDDYFLIVDKVELIPELKKFVAVSHIQSVKAAWDFFKKYNFRDHVTANDAYDFRQLVDQYEFDRQYGHNTPYTPRDLPFSPQTMRASTSVKLPNFPVSDHVQSAGSKFIKRKSKINKKHHRKSRKNL